MSSRAAKKRKTEDGSVDTTEEKIIYLVASGDLRLSGM